MLDILNVTCITIVVHVEFYELYFFSKHLGFKVKFNLIEPPRTYSNLEYFLKTLKSKSRFFRSLMRFLSMFTNLTAKLEIFITSGRYIFSLLASTVHYLFIPYTSPTFYRPVITLLAIHFRAAPGCKSS